MYVQNSDISGNLTIGIVNYSPDSDLFVIIPVENGYNCNTFVATRKHHIALVASIATETKYKTLMRKTISQITESLIEWYARNIKNYLYEKTQAFLKTHGIESTIDSLESITFVHNWVRYAVPINATDPYDLALENYLDDWQLNRRNHNEYTIEYFIDGYCDELEKVEPTIRELTELAIADAKEFCEYMRTNEVRVLETRVTSLRFDGVGQTYIGAEIYRTDERACYRFYLEAVKQTLHTRKFAAMQPTKTGRASACYTITSDIFGTFTFSNSVRLEADHEVETATPIHRNGAYYLSWHTTAAFIQSGLIQRFSEADIVLLFLRLKDVLDKKGHVEYLRELRQMTGTCIY